MKQSAKLRKTENDHYVFWCPGCQMMHVYDQRWTFNGDFDKPTFSPSLLSKIPGGIQGRTCHLYLREGKIEYLGDCSHELAGLTVELPEIPS